MSENICSIWHCRGISGRQAINTLGTLLWSPDCFPSKFKAPCLTLLERPKTHLENWNFFLDHLKLRFTGFFHRQRHSETNWFVTSSFPAVSNCFCWPFPSERKGSLQILLFWLFPSDQKGRADPNFACFCQTVELSQLYDLKCARRPVKYDVVFEIVELTHFRKSCLNILLIRIQLYDFEKKLRVLWCLVHIWNRRVDSALRFEWNTRVLWVESSLLHLGGPSDGKNVSAAKTKEQDEPSHAKN